MKKILISGVVVMASVFGVNAAHAESITVGNCEGCDYTTIQEAVDAAVDNDTITIEDGTYEENIIVPRGLEVYIRGNADDYSAVEINGSITINGRADAEIEYLTIDTNENYGVKVKRNGNVHVWYGTVRNAQRNLVVDRGAEMSVFRMTVEDAQKHNVLARHNAVLDLQNSTVSGAEFSNIRAITSNDITVKETTISDSPRGIFLFRVKAATLIRNDFENITGNAIVTRHSCDVFTNDNDFSNVENNQYIINGC